ncbi:MAG: MIP family channel protein [Candidatus Gracilibacteria bacterium]
MLPWKKYVAELLGTFMLIFAGAGSIMAYEANGIPETLGVAIAHGLAIMIGVYAFGGISGAHMNPAVTIGLWVGKKIRTNDVPGYILAQLVGASLAALILKLMFIDTLAATLGIPALGPGVSPLSGVIAEAVMTFLLVWTVYAVAVDGENKTGNMAGLVIGGVIALDIMVGGALTGGAMNPARWFGPALISNTWSHWYVYLAGPLVGSLLAATTSLFFMRKKA